MGNIGDSFFQFQIALLVTMAFLAEQSKLDINLRSQFSQMRVAGRNINQSVCVGGKTFLEFCMNFINTFLQKNTTISKIQHKIQGNIFLPPYFRFFFLKERLPIRDVEKITNAEHNGRKIRCSTPSSQRITPCPPGVRQIRNSSRIRNVPPMNLIFWGCHRTVGSVSLHIHPSNNSGSAKRS